MWEKFSLTFLVFTFFSYKENALFVFVAGIVVVYLMALLEWWCNHLKIDITLTLWQINVEFVHSFDKTPWAPLHINVYDFSLQFYFYFAVYYARALTLPIALKTKQSHSWDLIVITEKPKIFQHIINEHTRTSNTIRLRESISCQMANLFTANRK